MRVTLIPQHFGCLAFDHQTSQYLPFDEAGTQLLQRAIETPLRVLVRENPETQPFFEAFYTRGFFGIDGRLAGQILAADPPDDHLLGPLSVHLEVIATCNLACSHCFASPLPRTGQSLTLKEIDDLFAQLAAIGTFRIGLTGGEPLLRKDLLDIIDAATHHNLHPCLTTNGHFVTRHLAEAFATRPGLWVNVSLDGATAESNDVVRGQGSFARTLQGFAELQKADARFTAAFTLMKHNHHEVQACARLAHQLGACNAVFRPLYPVGDAQDRSQMPTFAQYKTAVAQLTDLGQDINIIDEFTPDSTPGVVRVFPEQGCAAGNTSASVSHDGWVNPCSFLGSEMDAANVREQPFAQIWNDGHTFRQLRGAPNDDFDGGCRARAKAYSGTVFDRDPWAIESRI